MPLPSSLAVLELAADERPRLRARRPVSLPLVVLVVGAVYFLWVALLGTRVVVLQGLEPTVTVEDWVQGGAALMGVLLLILLADYARVRRHGLPQAAAPALQGLPEVPATRHAADEIVVTAEEVQGRRVLEYSRPPKSEHTAAVYAKCLVPVDAQFVLRVEDLVAEARE